IGFTGALLEAGEHMEAEKATTDDERYTGHTHQSELPAKRETDDKGSNDAGSSLHDGAESDTGDTSQVIGLSRKKGDQSTSCILVLIEKGNVLPKNIGDCGLSCPLNETLSRDT